MFVLDDSQDLSELSRNVQSGNATLHDLLLAQKEKLIKNAKRKKRKLRAKWYNYYMVLRQLRLMEIQQSFLNAKANKLENACIQASVYVMKNMNLDLRIKDISNDTKPFFQPLKNLPSPDFTLPNRIDFSEDLAQMFINSYSFENINKQTAQFFTNPIVSELNEMDIHSNDYSAIDNPEYDVSRKAARKMQVNVTPNLSKQMVLPLVNFDQDTFILSSLSRYQSIADKAALQAVESINFGKLVLPEFGDAVMPRLRPFLRLAYPRWDTEDPLTLGRPDTLNTDSITTFFESQLAPLVVPSKAGALRIAEAEAMLGDADAAIREVVDAFMPTLIADRVFAAMNVQNAVESAPKGSALLEASDPLQDVSESLGFVGDEVRAGLLEFCGERVGVPEAAEAAGDFQRRLAREMVASAVSACVFGRVADVVPFLKGAADQKRHKQEGLRRDFDALSRKSRDRLLMSIRSLLD